MKNWIDRYLFAVGEKLSKKIKSDITEELHSSILDALDERIEEKRGQFGKDYEATEEDTLAVLEAFGAPAEVAKQYLPSHRYLIGPELFDVYQLVMTITLIAVAIGLTIATVISALQTNSDVYKFVYQLPGEILSALISSVGSVTIIFAMIQYFTPEHKLNGFNMNKEWRAKELEAIPFPYNRIKRSETIVAICFTLLRMMILNLFPDIIALFQFKDGVTTKIPLFNLEILKQYMLFFNILWIAQLLQYGYNLKRGSWTVISRIFAIVLGFVSLAIVLYALGNKDLINQQVNTFPELLGQILKGAIAIAILGTVWDSVKHVYYIFKK